MTPSPSAASAVIGILGGMGPYAGVDLARRVLDETVASRDQDHIPCILHNATQIPDRTAFLLGKASTDPARPMANALLEMAHSGATTAGIACNTAHADPIFNAVRDRLKKDGTDMVLFHIIDETVLAIRRHFPDAKTIGILGTQGTYRFRLYDRRIERAGLRALLPPQSVRDGLLNDAIYHSEWGIKARSRPVTREARDAVAKAADGLLQAGADLVVLGCTELPLAAPTTGPVASRLVDATRMLARALVGHAAPDRLRPF